MLVRMFVAFSLCCLRIFSTRESLVEMLIQAYMTEGRSPGCVIAYYIFPQLM